MNKNNIYVYAKNYCASDTWIGVEPSGRATPIRARQARRRRRRRRRRVCALAVSLARRASLHTRTSHRLTNRVSLRCVRLQECMCVRVCVCVRCRMRLAQLQARSLKRAHARAPARFVCVCVCLRAALSRASPTNSLQAGTLAGWLTVSLPGSQSVSKPHVRRPLNVQRARIEAQRRACP